jgi:hypothetical protein
VTRICIFSLLLLFLIACEKDSGFQPDIITGEESKTELRLSVRHFYQFTPFVLDTGVSDVTIYAYQNFAELTAFGSADRVRQTDSLGEAFLGAVGEGWWYFRSNAPGLGQSIDSVYVSPGGGWQVYEIWFP